MDVDYEDEAVRRSGKDAYLIGASAMYAYSPKGEYFVNVALAVDKHRLRVYDTTTGKSVAEHSVELGRVTSMSWQTVDAELAVDAQAATRKKKRKTMKDHEAGASSGTVQVVALGLSTGSLVFFSPIRDEVIYTSPPVATMSPILAMATSSLQDEEGRTARILWTSSSDGSIKAHNLRTNALLGVWRDADRTPYTCISIRPGPLEKEGEAHVLAGHHSIRLFAVSLHSSSPVGEVRTLKPIASFTGHVSPVNTLLWSRPASSSTTPSSRFISAAEGDRIAQMCDVPATASNKSAQGHVVATISLDSDVIQLGYPSESSQTLLALSTSGFISLYRVPASLPHQRNSTPLLSLTPQSTISTAAGSSATSGAEHLVAAQFIDATPGHLNVACIVSSRPVFQTVRYLDDSNNFAQEIEVDLSRAVKAAPKGKPTPGSRYSERTAHVQSGMQPAEDLDDTPMPVEGELDTDMAEMSLGERMKIASRSQPGVPNGITHDSGGDDNDDVGPSSSLAPVTSATLTRTLTQALHSSDSRLLDTCLQQHDPTVVKETVRHLRQNHVVTLIDELVDRLGRGGSGGKGGASTQQARTTVAWLRAVLLCHTAYLVTVQAFDRPDLVKRLSALHSVVNARSELQNRLQALSGRLDLVLSQVEMRAATKTWAKPTAKRVKTVQYIEGESSAEEVNACPNGDADSDVETEEGDDVGSVEDVELGSESDEEEEEELDDREDGHGGMNGLIDNEAEESSDEEEEDSEDESEADSEEDDESD
ncbi:Small subunit (SSU) processome component [Tulasnella sp. 331]|nr:Small subunit (SSU) processome component [Tulasnella sp. 331]